MFMSDFWETIYKSEKETGE